MLLANNRRYFKETSMQVRSYYSSHSDLISTLPNNIKKLFHDYVNRYSVAKVRAILGDSKELSYEFIGITDSWLTNTSIIEYKISKVLSVRDEQLRVYMPKKAMTILQAVKTMINDMKYFAYLLNEGLMAEYKSMEFPNIEKVLAVAPNTLEFKYCKEFTEAGLGIPRMLRKDYSLIADALELSEICATFYAQIDEKFETFKGTDIKFIDNLNIEIVRQTELRDNKSLAYFAYTLLNTKSQLILSGLPTVETIYSKLEIPIYTIYAKNGYRRATEREIANKVDGLNVTLKHPLTEESTANLMAYCYFVSGDEKYLTGYANKSELIKAFRVESFEPLEKLSSYFSDKQFERDITILTTLPPVEYLSVADDEVEDVELDLICKNVLELLNEKKEKDSKKKLYIADARAYDIANKVLTQKLIITEKQREVLYKAYKSENLYNSDIDARIMFCLQSGRLRRNSRQLDILSTVKRYESCSIKQLKVIDKIYASISGIDNPIKPFTYNKSGPFSETSETEDEKLVKEEKMRKRGKKKAVAQTPEDNNVAMVMDSAITENKKKTRKKKKSASDSGMEAAIFESNNDADRGTNLPPAMPIVLFDSGTLFPKTKEG